MIFGGSTSGILAIVHTALYTYSRAYPGTSKPPQLGSGSGRTVQAAVVSRLDDPQWALANITERQNEIAARAPQLAPLICRDFSPLSWEELRNHFTSHTSEGINMDAGGFNPFRPAYSELLPRENFVEALMRVFDAPFAAALSATGRASLEKEQVLTIKDVERRHPDYFAKAFGYALSELKNGRQ